MNKNSGNKKTLFIIFLTVFLNMLGIGLVIPVIAPMLLDVSYPVLHEDVSFSSRAIIIGILVATFPLAQFFGAPVLGGLSDRLGRKKVLLYTLFGSLFGYIIFAAGLMLYNLPLIFAGRFIDGITGGNIAIIYSSISDVSEAKAKTRNFGLVGMAFGLGFIIGPFVGGTLSDPLIVSWFNYSTPFLLAAILILLNIVLVIKWFPETLMIRNKFKAKWSDGFQNIARAFKIPNIRYILVIIFLTTFGFTFFTQFFQVFLTEKFSFRPSDIGKLFAYIGMWIAISQGLITRFASYFLSSETILKFSLPVLSLALAILLLPSDHSCFFLILPFVSVFQGLSQPNLLSILSNRTSNEKQGEILGINQSLQSLALAIPPIIAGFIVSFNINYPILLGSLCIMIAWILFLFVKESRKSIT